MNDVFIIRDINSINFCIVSIEDTNKVKDSSWYISPQGYFVRSSDNHTLRLLHRILLCPPKRGYCIDHINGDKRDNTRRNLRCVTHAINLHNKDTRNSTGYKGVYRDKSRNTWMVKFNFENKQKNFGRYYDQVTAGIISNSVLYNIYRDKARLNNIDMLLPVDK